MILDDLSFLSLHSMDKIVQSGEFTIVNGGAQAETFSNTINQPNIRTVDDTQTNEYDRAGLLRGRWSVDSGASWNDINTIIPFFPELDTYFMGSLLQSTNFPALRMQVALGSNEGEIIARTMSSYFSTTDFRGDIDGSGDITFSGWSPLSQTVLIQYWLFERE